MTARSSLKRKIKGLPMSESAGALEPAETFDRSLDSTVALEGPRDRGNQGKFGRLIDALSKFQWGRVGAALGLGLFVLAAFVIYHAAEDVTWAQLTAAISQVSGQHMLGAVAATAVSYMVLIGYDVLALRQVGASVPLATAATASFIGQAFTFTIGFGLLTGNAVRLRIYTAAGV